MRKTVVVVLVVVAGCYSLTSPAEYQTEQQLKDERWQQDHAHDEERACRLQGNDECYCDRYGTALRATNAPCAPADAAAKPEDFDPTDERAWKYDKPETPWAPSSSPSSSSSSSIPQCTKGCLCGNTCIECSKQCRINQGAPPRRPRRAR